MYLIQVLKLWLTTSKVSVKQGPYLYGTCRDLGKDDRRHRNGVMRS